MKKILFLIFLTISLLAVNVSAEKDAGILPNNPFYGFETAFEEIEIAFTIDKQKKAEKALDSADERLAEIEIMTEQGNTKGVERASKSHEKSLEKFKKEVEFIKAQNKDSEVQLESVVKLEAQVETHEEKLNQIKGLLLEIKKQLSSDQEEKLTQFLDSLEENTHIAKIKVSEEKQKQKQEMKSEGYTNKEVEKTILETERKVKNDAKKDEAKNAITSAKNKITKAKRMLDDAKGKTCFDDCLKVKSFDLCNKKCGNSEVYYNNLITGNMIMIDTVCGDGIIQEPNELCDGDTSAYYCSDDCMSMTEKNDSTTPPPINHAPYIKKDLPYNTFIIDEWPLETIVFDVDMYFGDADGDRLTYTIDTEYSWLIEIDSSGFLTILGEDMSGLESICTEINYLPNKELMVKITAKDPEGLSVYQKTWLRCEDTTQSKPDLQVYRLRIVDKYGKDLGTEFDCENTVFNVIPTIKNFGEEYVDLSKVKYTVSTDLPNDGLQAVGYCKEAVTNIGYHVYKDCDVINLGGFGYTNSETKTVTVEVDYGNAITESDESNNKKSMTVKCIEEEVIEEPTGMLLTVELGKIVKLPGTDQSITLKASGNLAVVSINYDCPTTSYGTRHTLGSSRYTPSFYSVDGVNMISRYANTMYRYHKACGEDISKSDLWNEGLEIIDLNGYSNIACANRKQEQCYNDGSFDNYYDERCDFDDITIEKGKSYGTVTWNFEVVDITRGYIKIRLNDLYKDSIVCKDVKDDPVDECVTKYRTPTRDKYWEQLRLETSAHPEITKYRIQWWNGAWSKWYTTGVDDLDAKVNYDGTQRRMWSYFTDHNHEYMECGDAPNKLADLKIYSIEDDQDYQEVINQNRLYDSDGKRFVMLQAIVKNVGEIMSDGYKVTLTVDSVEKGTGFYSSGLHVGAKNGPVGIGNGYYLAEGWHTASFEVFPYGQDKDSSNNVMSYRFYVYGKDNETTDYSNACGDDKKEIICHKSGSHWEELSVSYDAVESYLNQGAYCGKCVVEDHSDKRMTFKLTFDGTMTDVEGIEPVSVRGTAKYSDDAMLGQSLRGVLPHEYFRYRCENVFNEYAGTVQAWAKFDWFGWDSVIWNTDDSKYVLFYDKGSRNGYKAVKARAGQPIPQYTDLPYYFDKSDTPTDTPNLWANTDWHFLAMTWEGSPAGELKLYVDGNYMGNQMFYAGDDCELFGVGNNFWPGLSWEHGKIDELEVYNYPKSCEEIQDAYNTFADDKPEFKCDGDESEESTCEVEDGKVTICHKSNAGEETISVSETALDTHIKHGDYCGTCIGEDEEEKEKEKDDDDEDEYVVEFLSDKELKLLEAAELIEEAEKLLAKAEQAYEWNDLVFAYDTATKAETYADIVLELI